MKQKFEALFTSRGPKGAWTFLPIPFDVQEVFGTKARVPVSGTINGFPFRSSLMPEGGGTHVMSVSKELLAGAKAKPGDLVQVVMEVDKAERSVEVPEELKKAWANNKKAAAFFAELSYSRQKEYVDWIVSAKRAETKASRIRKAIDMLGEGRKLTAD